MTKLLISNKQIFIIYIYIILYIWTSFKFYPYICESLRLLINNFLSGKKYKKPNMATPTTFTFSITMRQTYNRYYFSM